MKAGKSANSSGSGGSLVVDGVDTRSVLKPLTASLYALTEAGVPARSIALGVLTRRFGLSGVSMRRGPAVGPL